MDHLRKFALLLLGLCHLGSSVLAQVPSGCDGWMDVVFLLDSSESMVENDPFGKPYYNWEMVKNLTREVMGRLPVETGEAGVGLLQYATDVKRQFDLDELDHSQLLMERVDTMAHMGGYTFTSKALEEARREFDAYGKPGRRRVLVVVTDGLSNYDMENTVGRAEDLKAGSVEVYALGVTHYIDERELQGIASSPASKYFIKLSDFGLFRYYVDLLVHRLCNLPDPVPDPVSTTAIPGCPPDCAFCTADLVCVTCPPGKYLAGTTCVDCVDKCSVCKGPNSCELCELNYYWNEQERRCIRCEVQMDLVILVDNSGSINDKGADNYNRLKSFLAEFVNTLDVGQNKTRVGALRFSETAQIEFRLDRYFTEEGINDAIKRMGYQGSHTNIAQAIRVARTQMFGLTGDRPDVRNVLLLITDGESTRESNLTESEAQQARDDGIILFVVGVTNEINLNELHGVASKPVQDHYFNASDIAALDKIFKGLIKQVCRRRIVKRSLRCSSLDSPFCLEDGSLVSEVTETLKKTTSGYQLPLALATVVLGLMVAVYRHTSRTLS